MKFAFAPIDLPTDLSNAIIDDKAEAKKKWKIVNQFKYPLESASTLLLSCS